MKPTVGAVAKDLSPEAREYPSRPIVGVGVVVWRDDEVLLIERGKPPLQGTWSIPGGAQEVGETVAEAGRREVLEETGVEVEITGLVDVVDSIRHDDEGRIRSHYTLIDLTGEWIGGELRPGDDASDCRWVRLDELPAYELWSETLRIIRRAAELRPR